MHSDAFEIRDGRIFDFYTGLPHVHSSNKATASNLQLEVVYPLGESEETVRGENQLLEVVAAAEALGDALQLVAGRQEVLQLR